MEKVIGIYRITYPKYGTSQVKNLISHDDYENIYKPWTARKTEIETELAELNKKKHPDKAAELSSEIKTIKRELLRLFGSEFFTDKSPIWLSQANSNHMLLSPWQGGVIDVILEKIN